MRHLHSYRWNGGIFPLQSNGIKEIGKPEQPEEEVVVDVACCCWAVSTIIIIIIADVVGDDDVVVDDWFIIIISIGINNEFLQRKQTNHTHTLTKSIRFKNIKTSRFCGKNNWMKISLSFFVFYIYDHNCQIDTFCIHGFR